MPAHHKTGRGTKKGHQRIAGKKRKGTSGNAANFITRQQAIKKLQITLPEFRKLCILHGIYPREPRKSPKGKDKTYFYLKDIQFLLHDSLLQQFRDYGAWKHKVTKAKHKKEPRKLESLLANKPKYRLDHVILRRYPTFDSAIEDLDDALCMLYLFSSVGQGHRIPAPRIQNCNRLCREWESIVALKSSLRKVFVTIKGIYYQAEVSGQRVTWMVPHQFTYPVPDDVDIRVMLSFLEFYESLMSFILFKLYHDEEIPYPLPTLPLGNSFPCQLSFQSTKTVQPLPAPIAASSKISRASSSSQTEKQRQTEKRIKTLSGKLGDILEKDEENDDDVLSSESEDDIDDTQSTHPIASLFSNCSVLLSREVPHSSLEFCIKSCGGKVSWEPLEETSTPMPFSEDEATHHIVDRPLQNHVFLDRNYVQPQWVYDCVNTGILLPVEDYLPGNPLPPHLSPFVNDQQEGYVPDQRKRLDALIAKSQNENFEMEDGAEKNESVEDEKEEVDLEQKYQEELNQEISGIKFSEGSNVLDDASQGKKSLKPATSDAPPKEEEENELASIMIPSKKKRRLYQRIQYSERTKRRKTDTLERKKEEIASKK